MGSTHLSISGEAKSVKALADSYNDNFRFGEEATPKMDSQKIRYAATLDESTFNTNNSYVLYRAGRECTSLIMCRPTFLRWSGVADTDLIAEMNEYRSVISDMVRTAYTEFILGLRDLDTEWDSYLAELNDAGLEQYIEDMNRYYANWNFPLTVWGVSCGDAPAVVLTAHPGTKARRNAKMQTIVSAKGKRAGSPKVRGSFCSALPADPADSVGGLHSDLPRHVFFPAGNADGLLRAARSPPAWKW